MSADSLAYSASGRVREAYRPSSGDTASSGSVMPEPARGDGKSVSERYHTPMHTRGADREKRSRVVRVRAYNCGLDRNY
jgi:hypothetical protein